MHTTVNIEKEIMYCPERLSSQIRVEEWFKRNTHTSISIKVNYAAPARIEDMIKVKA